MRSVCCQSLYGLHAGREPESHNPALFIHSFMLSTPKRCCNCAAAERLWQPSTLRYVLQEYQAGLYEGCGQAEGCFRG